MKKKIAFIGLAIVGLSLTAFGISNIKKENSNSKKDTIGKLEETSKSLDDLFEKKEYDFHISVGTRFTNVATLEDIQNANSIEDFIPQEQIDQVSKYTSVKITLLDDYKETDIFAIGKDDILTADQKKILQSLDYSSNFLVRGDFVGTKEFQRNHNYSYFTPFMTVIPHTEGYYEQGMDALLYYLRAKSEEISSQYQKEDFKSGKLYFTISKEGKISNINLTSTGGFTELDNKMVEILNNLEGKWIPAKNAKGETVEQTLVIAFGVIGC